MGKSSVRQLPLKLRTGAKTDARAQFAALCWRMKKDQMQICLITSRTRRRWIKTHRPVLYEPLTVPSGMEQDTRVIRFDKKGV